MGRDVAYGVAATPDGGAVVVGTSGLVKYDLSGDLVWKVDYPGVGYAVAVDGEGNVYVAGSAGLYVFGPDGEPLWSVKGTFRWVTLGPDGTIVALKGSKLIEFGPDRQKLGEIPCPGEAFLVDVYGQWFVVGERGAAVILDPEEGKPVLSLPPLGELRDVALGPGDEVFVIGSHGLRAYDGNGALLWEQEFPGEPAAGSVYTGPEGRWLVVTGAVPDTKEVVLAAYSLDDGGLVWKLVRRPKRSVQVHDMAAVPGSGIFYVAGAEAGRGDIDYLASQYVLASPASVVAGKGEGKTCSIAADFSFSPESPMSGDEVSFRDRTVGEPVAWAWDFGDGSTSRERNPSHVYPSPGTYAVTLTVVDAEGCSDSVRKTIVVGNRSPVVEGIEYEFGLRADFTWDVEREAHGDYPQGFVPEEATDLDDIDFTDRSGCGEVTLRAVALDPDGEIVAYEWDLDFDGEIDAEGQEVTWDFGGPGVYPVVLIVVDDRGGRTRYEDFVDTGAQEIVDWEWDFGDDTTSDEQNPTHWFQDDGIYEVTLTVWDSFGNSDSITKEIAVANVPPQVTFSYETYSGGGELSADFTWDVAQEQHGSYPEGFSPEGPTDLDDILFEDLSTVSGGPGGARFTAEASDSDGEIVSYEWDFDGDGKTDAEGETVEWTPPESGTYRVRLTVTDDDGDTATYEEEIEIEAGGGGIVDWEWDFGDDTTSDEQNPTHWFQDDGVYEVTLTVWDSLGNSDSVTKEVAIGNVPPVADFNWDFQVPDEFLPSCDELIGGEPEVAISSAAGKAASFAVGGEGGGVVCREPEVPGNAGVVAFQDLSHDSEPWLGIADRNWQWNFDGYAECWGGGDCSTEEDPLVIFLWDTEQGEGFLYRGDVDVSLQVSDDDGATSTVTKTVEIGNIPPYAAFEWQDWGSSAELSCSSCASTYGSGDATKQDSNGQITVTRTIESWDCGGVDEEESSAILAPWGGASVELTIEGSGTVEVTETIPEGWSYWLDTDNECVTITEQGDNSWSATVDLDACDGSVSIWYDLYPPDPWEGEPVQAGTYTISGVFTAGSSVLSLDSTVVVCDIVDVDASVYFHGYGWDNIWMADPNGDDIDSWSWIINGQEMEGQDPCGEDTACEFHFENLTCQFDEESGSWVWSIPVSLTVTDEAGGKTTVEATITLPCGMGGPE